MNHPALEMDGYPRSGQVMTRQPLEWAVLGALEQACPDKMVGVLRVLLARHLGATGVRLLLANHQLTALHPIQEQDDRDVSTDSAAGRAFDTQHVFTDVIPGGNVTVYLPVGVRGDRVGVLELTTADALGHGQLNELRRVADAVAYAMLAMTHQSDSISRAAQPRRMTLAAELQWQLLPGRGCHGPGYDIAGHIAPAPQSRASNFDWSHDRRLVQVSVTTAESGQRHALMLPTLAVTALRNARGAGMGPADQATLAGQAIFAHHHGHEYMDSLLMTLDPHTGAVTAVVAGSPRLFVVRDGKVLQAQLTSQDPLGRIDGTEYHHECFTALPADRVVLMTGAVSAASSARDESIALSSLTRLLVSSRAEPVTTVARAMIDRVREQRDVSPRESEAAVLLLDVAGSDAGFGTAQSKPSVELRPASTLRLVDADDRCPTARSGSPARSG